MFLPETEITVIAKNLTINEIPLKLKDHLHRVLFLKNQIYNNTIVIKTYNSSYTLVYLKNVLYGDVYYIIINSTICSINKILDLFYKINKVKMYLYGNS